MYKLKEKYKGVTATVTGRYVILDNVKPEQVELLGVKSFFDKIEKKNDKKINKPNKKQKINNNNI
jgi:hypothetical protein|tara:strand:+ start:133 stop:327 length:195 start_codon:yes stop_codon:yes gene_type:complete